MYNKVSISAWWPTRVLLHTSFFLVLVYIVIRNGLKSDWWYLIAVIFYLETTLFSYKIEIEGENIKYWRWPKYLSKGILINRANIIRIENVPVSYGRKIKLAIFDVYLNGTDKPIRISLGVFSPKNVRFILDWLGYNQKSDAGH